jgi:hypothetical protein
MIRDISGDVSDFRIVGLHMQQHNRTTIKLSVSVSQVIPLLMNLNVHYHIYNSPLLVRVYHEPH